ncbi:GSDMD isoform 16, partial [Pan troglodytes]
RELCQLLLKGLEGVLRDQLALRALEEALEQGQSLGPVEPLDGPAGAVLECLVFSSGVLVLELAIPVVYLLGALTMLSETQHKLLAEALESQTLLGPLELPLGAECPVAGAQHHVPAPRAPGEQLGRRGTGLGLAGRVWPGAGGGHSPRVLGAAGPGPHVCTLRLPGTAIRTEPGAPLACARAWPGSSPAGQSVCPPAASPRKARSPVAMWPVYHGAQELGKHSKGGIRRK